MQASGTDHSDLDRAESLYFLPDSPMSAGELRHLLAHGSPDRRAWAVSHLLRYADWDDIWVFVTRDKVRELLGDDAARGAGADRDYLSFL